MSFVDPQIDEIKALAEKALALAEDTNRMVHRLQRRARWGTFFRFLSLLVILGASGVSFYYLRPYTQRAVNLYEQLHSGSAEALRFEANFVQTLQSLNALNTGSHVAPGATTN